MRCARLSLAATILFSLTRLGQAQQAFDPTARVALIAPFIDQQTVAIAHVDLNYVDIPATLKMIQQLNPSPSPAEAAEIDIRSKQAIDARAALLKAGAVDWYFLGTMARAGSSTPGFGVLTVRPGGDANAAAEALKEITAPEQPFVHQGAVIVGPADIKDYLGTFQPQPREELAAAFKAAGNTAVQIVFLPNAALKGMAAAALPPIPDQMGGGAVVALRDKMRWLSVTANLPPQPALGLIIEMNDTAAAETVKAGAVTALDMLKQSPLLPPDQTALIVQLLAPQVKEAQLRIILTQGNGGIPLLAGLLAPALAAAKQRAAGAGNPAAPPNQ